MSQNVEAKIIAECFQKAFASDATQLEDGSDLPEIVLVDVFLSSCMVVFLTYQWSLQESQHDRSVILPTISEIVTEVNPKQYLDPETKARALSETYVFMLILETALRLHAQTKPEHDRVEEIRQLHTLVCATLSYKYFHQVDLLS